MSSNPKSKYGFAGAAYNIEGDEGMPPLAVVRLAQEGVQFMWLPELFLTGLINDELRADLVKLLRFHADRLEQKDIDRRIHELFPTGGPAKAADA